MLITQWVNSLCIRHLSNHKLLCMLSLLVCCNLKTMIYMIRLVDSVNFYLIVLYHYDLLLCGGLTIFINDYRCEWLLGKYVNHWRRILSGQSFTTMMVPSSVLNWTCLRYFIFILLNIGPFWNKINIVQLWVFFLVH